MWKPGSFQQKEKVGGPRDSRVSFLFIYVGSGPGIFIYLLYATLVFAGDFTNTSSAHFPQRRSIDSITPAFQRQERQPAEGT